MLATSLATAGCFAFELLRRNTNRSDRNFMVNGLLTAIGLTFIAVSSISLLAGGWLPEIKQELRPDQFTTLSVAAWWATGALTCGWLGHRYRSRILGGACAVLVPAVVFLMMPLWLPSQWWVWIQTAAIASGLLAVTLSLSANFVSSRRHSGPDAVSSDSSPTLADRSMMHFGTTIDLSLAICVSVGVTSCLVLIIGLIQNESDWMRLHNPAGVILAVLTAGLVPAWNAIASSTFLSRGKLSWSIALTLTSGHLALLLTQFAMPGISAHWWLAILWAVTAAISLAEYVRIASKQSESGLFNCWHSGMLVIASSMMCLVDGSSSNQFTLGVIACLVGGMLATARAVIANWDHSRGIAIRKRSMIATRGWCWYIAGMGILLVIRLSTVTSGSEFQLWTMLIAWGGRNHDTSQCHCSSGRHELVTGAASVAGIEKAEPFPTPLFGLTGSA